MPWKLVHIRYELRGAFSCGGTADSAIEGNIQTSMSSLVRADLQMRPTNCSIKSGPMEMIERVVEFADNGSHCSRPVAWLGQERINSRADVVISA